MATIDRVPVVRDVDLLAAEGERIALVGPNGGGKSTLGRLLVGLLRPQHGTVRLNGKDPAGLPPAYPRAPWLGASSSGPNSSSWPQASIDEVTLGLRSDESGRLLRS